MNIYFSSTVSCGLNSHWNPYYFNCDYCQIKYQAIGKLENWYEDLENINNIAKINLPEKTFQREQNKRDYCRECNFYKNIYLSRHLVMHSGVKVK